MLRLKRFAAIALALCLLPSALFAALPAQGVWEVRGGSGSDSSGGGFGFGVGGTDVSASATLAIDAANPLLVTSSAHNFVAGDVGKYINVTAGTGWTIGWFQITAAAGNAATLNYSPSAAGNANLGTFTLYTGIDHTQQNAAFTNGTNLTVDAGTNTKVNPDGYTITTNDVGNYIQITTTGTGAAFTVGFYQITAVTTGGSQRWTLDRSPAAVNSAGATWAMGGALATPGKAMSAFIGGNYLWVKAATYSITSASTNIASGCLSVPAGTSALASKVIGYGTTRGDFGTKPLLQASSITTFTLVTLAANNVLTNIALDGAASTSSKGVTIVGSSRAELCQVKNCTNNGLNVASGGIALNCEVTGCSTAAAIQCSGFIVNCVVHDNTFTAITTASSSCMAVNCIASNNTGAATQGFNIGSGGRFVDCLAYNNGQHGFDVTASTGGQFDFYNCCAANNTGTGFVINSSADNIYLYNCAVWSNGTNVSANIQSQNQIGLATCTATPFNNAAGNDFSLNNNTGAGAALRAAGIPSASGTWALPFLSTPSSGDIGPAQHPGNVTPIIIGS